MRNVLGGLLALIGAAATLVSPWHAWYNNRHGSSYKFYEVFGSGVTASRSGIMDSVFLLFLVTAVLAVAGVLLRSRTLVGVAGVVALGFTILWMVRQGQAAGELTVTGSNNRGLGSGVAYAFGGSLLMIIGSLMMTGRPRPVVVAESTETTRAARAAGVTGVAGVAGTRTADQSAHTGSTAAAPPAITTTAPVDKNRPAPPPTAAASGQTASDRTGTERLSKEEREMLGLDEDAKTPPKNQN